jgi:hypothetical protein
VLQIYSPIGLDETDATIKTAVKRGVENFIVNYSGRGRGRYGVVKCED